MFKNVQVVSVERVTEEQLKKEVKTTKRRRPKWNAKRFISNMLVAGLLIGGMFVVTEMAFRAWEKEDNIRQQKIQEFRQSNEEAARENLGINYNKQQ